MARAPPFPHQQGRPYNPYNRSRETIARPGAGFLRVRRRTAMGMLNAYAPVLIRPPSRGLAVISVVIPLVDEASTLKQLHRELAHVAQRCGYALEIVLVDDGSTEASWGGLKELAASDQRGDGIRLPRNFL